MERKNRENISEIKSRLLQYIDFLNITREEFYKKVSLNGANFRGKSALSELSGDKIANILRCYPELSPDWLLLGEGEILRQNSEKTTGNLTPDSTFPILLKRIEDLATEKGLLQAEIYELKKELARITTDTATSVVSAAG